MQSLFIIHRLQEIGNSFLDIGKGLIFPEVNFFRFQGFKEALCFGVVVRVAFSGHTDLKAAALQPLGVISGRILHPAVGMVDYSRGGVSPADGHIQGGKCQRGVQVPGDAVADDPAGEGVQDNRQINKARLYPDVGDVGYPDLVYRRWRVLFYQVRIDWVAVVGVGGGCPAFLDRHQQGTFPHDA